MTRASSALSYFVLVASAPKPGRQRACRSRAPAGSAMSAAEPLGSGDVSLPKAVRDMLVRGRVSWLRNEDVVDLLHNWKQYKFRVSKEPPVKPPGAPRYQQAGETLPLREHS